MDKPKATPKDFFLWAGAMIALYSGVFAFVSLIFDYINYTFPDTALAQYYGDPYSGSISYEMASLIVLAPVLLVLMRVIRRAIQADPSRAEVWVRRWALFLTLFVAGATIVVDLIVLLTTFLQGGDLTTAFLLKVLVVLLVAAAGFMHFMADVWGYWARYPAYARYVNYAVGVLVVLTIAAGFLIIGSPQQQRALRIDQQRVSDLQNIQWQVVTYWQQKTALPTKLEDLRDPISGVDIPVDPVTKEAYTYKRQSPLDFTLCATFSTKGGDLYGRTISKPMAVGGVSEVWDHKAGETCFDRSIDPQRYPPYPKGV
ncbi:hypothetical protein EXS62_01270 [Candidatus Kaiserbacteria bacterium]|nr:hypothetical protein [Candidatus Kaiserbacteria bacterium]